MAVVALLLVVRLIQKHVPELRHSVLLHVLVFHYHPFVRKINLTPQKAGSNV